MGPFSGIGKKNLLEGEKLSRDEELANVIGFSGANGTNFKLSRALLRDVEIVFFVYSACHLSACFSNFYGAAIKNVLIF